MSAARASARPVDGPFEISRRLAERLRRIRLPDPITHVYNPLEYARAPHAAYVSRYGTGRKEALLIGMNPGPWGMVQTGVPFGDVGIVRDWMGIEAEVGQPETPHPKRPVFGFSCPRGEVSGRRLWGWARDTFGEADRFFRRFFVVNYCPLALFDRGGANITPDKIPAGPRAELEAVCDEALRAVVEALRPRYVVGIGGYAESRARAALEGMDVAIGKILPPSPASPAANRGWAMQATAALEGMGVAIERFSSQGTKP